jgi:hypothetical protein
MCHKCHIIRKLGSLQIHWQLTFTTVLSCIIMFHTKASKAIEYSYLIKWSFRKPSCDLFCWATTNTFFSVAENERKMKSEWLLFNANSAIFQLYHGEIKLIFNEVPFVLIQHAKLDFYSSSSLKQQSAGRQIAPLGHIILILSRPVIALSP